MAEEDFFEQGLSLSELIFQALGAASMCWDPRPSDQVFDSTKAKAIGDELTKRILDLGFKSYPYQEGDFFIIGPESLTDAAQTVICYRGENFYRSCGKTVKTYSNGTTGHCIKPVGHKQPTCEDGRGSVSDVVGTFGG